MKKLPFFLPRTCCGLPPNGIVFLFVLLFLSSCGRDDDDIKKSEAVFRISYTQQGDLEGFTKMFTYDTNLASSDDFVWFDTKQTAPDFLNTDSLTAGSYVLETKGPVREISFNISIGWIPTRSWDADWQGPDEIEVVVYVWQDDELMATEAIEISSADQPATGSIQKSYQVQP